MTVDLAEVNAEWLVQWVPRNRNSSPLIAHIRGGGPITPALANLVADILDGTVIAKPKKSKATDVRHSPTFRLNLNYQVEWIKRRLDQPSDDEWNDLEALLAAVGCPNPDSKPERTRAAAEIVAHLNGLTRYQLDECRFPRRSRAKSRT